MPLRLLTLGFLALLGAAAVSGQGPQSAGTPQRRSPESAGTLQRPQRSDPRTAPAAAPSVSAAGQRAVLDKYCVGCHNARVKTGGLALDELDLSRLADHAEVAESVALKVRAGMMPPIGAPRPERATLDGLVTWIEGELDRNAAPNLIPPGIHRLNRAEYQNVMRDLLGLEIDAAKFLPSDNSSYGFDNIAGALTTSPALMEGYLSAAGKISALAMASNSQPLFAEFSVPGDATQNYHVEGLPFGTRGGMLIEYEFPADGEYVFRIVPIFEGNMGQANDPFGQIQGERLSLTIDGKQARLFDWDKEMVGAPRSGVPTLPIAVTAGHHRVGVTFLANNYAPDNNINALFDRTTIETGDIPGYVFFPHVAKVVIEGPFNPRGVSETPSRRKIFVCRPAAGSSAREEEACARTILSTLARRAYRRPVTPVDVDVLMGFYASGLRDGFDDRIELAL